MTKKSSMAKKTPRKTSKGYPAQFKEDAVKLAQAPVVAPV